MLEGGKKKGKYAESVHERQTSLSTRPAGESTRYIRVSDEIK